MNAPHAAPGPVPLDFRNTSLRHAPLLLPAAALAAGSWLALQLAWLSVPLLAVLALLGLAHGRRTGIYLAALAAGALAATVQHGLPARADEAFATDRPVAARVRVSGHWQQDEEGWSAPAEVLSLLQGLAVTTPDLEIVLHLPGEEEPPPFGSILRARGYLTRSPGFANRVPVPPGPWRLRVKSRALLQVEAEPQGAAWLSGVLRRRVERAFAAAGPRGDEGPGEALARALVLGDTSGLSTAEQRGLRRAGLSHLMSVSGLHVALVAGAVLLAGSWLPRRLRLLLVLSAVALYLLLVGPLPALVRASIMGLLAATALLVDRPPAPANALGWAIALLVLDRPDVVTLPTFQLSAAATAGLLLLAPPLAARWGHLPRWLVRPLAISVGAQLATLPLALPLFHLATPLAPLANMLAVPWAALVLLVDLGWTALALVTPSAAAHLLPVLDLLAAPFAWPGELPPSVLPGLPLLVSPAAALLLAGSLAMLLLARRRAVRLLAVVLLAAIAWHSRGGGTGRSARRSPEIALFDVGQGDAILLRDGPHAILVDGGGWRGGDLGGRVLLPALLGEGVRSLAAVVMTHPDRDHCSGLVDVSAYVPVAEVWMAPGWDPMGCAGELLALPGVRVRPLWSGETASVGRWGLLVLHPEPGDRGSVVNARSLVLRAEVFGHRALLTGDADFQAERSLAGRWRPDDLRSDLLKVGHHGSRGSTGTDFLATVAPRLALVSVGLRNVYHHPASDLVERIERQGVRLLRTDRDGEVLLAFGADGRLRLSLPGTPR